MVGDVEKTEGSGEVGRIVQTEECVPGYEGLIHFEF